MFVIYFWDMHNSNEIYDGNDKIELESVKDDTDDEVNDFFLSCFF